MEHPRVAGGDTIEIEKAVANIVNMQSADPWVVLQLQDWTQG
jgi:hypothetical protein